MTKLPPTYSTEGMTRIATSRDQSCLESVRFVNHRYTKNAALYQTDNLSMQHCSSSLELLPSSNVGVISAQGFCMLVHASIKSVNAGAFSFQFVSCTIPFVTWPHHLTMKIVSLLILYKISRQLRLVFPH